MSKGWRCILLALAYKIWHVLSLKVLASLIKGRPRKKEKTKLNWNLSSFVYPLRVKSCLLTPNKDIHVSKHVVPCCFPKGQSRLKTPGFKPWLGDQIEVEIVSSLHPAHIQARRSKHWTVKDKCFGYNSWNYQNARRFQTNVVVYMMLHAMVNIIAQWLFWKPLICLSSTLAFSAILCVYFLILVGPHFDQIHLTIWTYQFARPRLDLPNVLVDDPTSAPITNTMVEYDWSSGRVIFSTTDVI